MKIGGGRNGSYEFCSIGYDFETVVLSLKRGKKKKKKWDLKKNTPHFVFKRCFGSAKPDTPEDYLQRT